MTVAELEPRLTMRELIAWQEFEDDFGPLTIHERLDAVIHAQTGEPVKWKRPVRWTDDMIWGWLGAEARKS